MKDEWEGVTVHHPRRIGFGKFLLRWTYRYYGNFYYRAVLPLVQQLWNEAPFDILDVHMPVGDGEAGIRFAQQYDIPITITIHGHSLTRAPKYDSSVIGGIRKSLHQANAVVVTGPWLHKRASSPPWDCPSGQMHIIPLGVDLELRYQRPDPKLQARYQNRQVIVVPGYLIPRKCQHLVISAVATLRGDFPEIQLIIIGDGIERKNLQRQARDLRVSDRVEFTGIIHQAEVFRYFSIADVVALPSKEEPFGMVYIEALAHGKPILACEGQGISPLVSEHRCGLLAPTDDEKTLTQALAQILRDPEFARAMGERGRKIVESQYTWDNNAKDHIRLFEQLIERSD